MMVRDVSTAFTDHRQKNMLAWKCRRKAQCRPQKCGEYRTCFCWCKCKFETMEVDSACGCWSSSGLTDLFASFLRWCWYARDFPRWQYVIKSIYIVKIRIYSLRPWPVTVWVLGSRESWKLCWLTNSLMNHCKHCSYLVVLTWSVDATFLCDQLKFWTEYILSIQLKLKVHRETHWGFQTY